MAKERHPESAAAEETKPKAPITYQVSEQPSTRVQEEEFAKQLRLAEAFFVFYSLEDQNWDVDTIPTGIRGSHGYKKLAEGLKRRDIKFHDGITAFGENLGWKGNVKAARIRRDTRFGGFSDRLQALSAEERRIAADLLASRIAESKYIMSPLPPIDAAVLPLPVLGSFLNLFLARSRLATSNNSWWPRCSKSIEVDTRSR
jgi:hypothetical protein